LEHTTLVGFSILVIERDPDAEHYLRRTLDGAGARVFAARTCKDAICTADELEVSAAVLDFDESRASRHTVALRLTDLHIPFVFCADPGQSCAPFVVPALYRPIVGAELIEMLRRLLRPPLIRAAATAIREIVSSTRLGVFSGGQGSAAQAPESTKFSIKETRGGKSTAAKQAGAAQIQGR
jgi:CheY-like chemotaxis protein